MIADRRPDLSIVVPVYNEDASVEEVLLTHLARADSLGLSFELLVVNDGSTDATGSLIERIARSDHRVRAWHHAANQGIALTLLELYAASRGRWVYYTPADGQVPAEALELMWAVRAGHGCVVGQRRPRADPLRRRLMAAIYSRILGATFGMPVKDIDSVKLVDGQLLRSLPIRSRSTFAEAEMLLRIARSGRTLNEVAIPHLPRRAGSERGATLRVIYRTCLDLARFVVMSRQPQGGDRSARQAEGANSRDRSHDRL